MRNPKSQDLLKKPKLRFLEFEGEWERKNGNEIFETISDKEPISKLPILAISQEYGAIPRDKIDYKISVTDKSVSSYKIVRKGNFIISLRSFQGGIEYSEYDGICSPAYIILKSKVEIIDYFYKYYLKTDRYIIELNKKLEGIRDGKMISYKYFSEIPLPFPTLSEQEKIAHFLFLIDERIQCQKKIIEKLETLIMRVFDNFKGNSENNSWKQQSLRDLLVERNENNFEKYSVFSVSVSKGLINQIEFLGRSFTAKDTKHYNVVCFGDIVYTKSPTGKFPYGIIKQSFIKDKVAVSPLYGVFEPKNIFIGNILHYYFSNPINTNNYLHSLIQKGAKNTINISNQDFLNKSIFLPVNDNEIKNIARLLNTLKEKTQLETSYLEQLKKQKQYLLQQMFI